MQLTDNAIAGAGAASGPGLALAEAFHERGNHECSNNVIAAGCRKAPLDEVDFANPGMEGIDPDIDAQDGRGEVADAPINRAGYVDDFRSAVDPRGRKLIPARLAPWRLKKAKALMIAYMAQGCSIQRIAQECAVSRSHFSRAFKTATGVAPHVWFRREQIRRAEVLLRTRQFSICRVAQECGFSDQSYFTRVFTGLKGVSPRRWQLQEDTPAADQGEDDLNGLG